MHQLIFNVIKEGMEDSKIHLGHLFISIKSLKYICHITIDI